MKKTILAAALAVLLLLSACGAPASSAGEDGTLHILATTYPVYLFATAVTDGVKGVEVTQLVNQQTACLHDYTLTVNDMKAIEKADVILLNGVGLEDFMSDALAASSAAVIDCSEGVALLPAVGHDGHDHDTEYDPHIWMDPDRAAQMAKNIGAGLALADPDHGSSYQTNARGAANTLSSWKGAFRATTASGQMPKGELITFHDGFQYFADAFGFTILKAIEEEEGSEASAQEFKEIVGLIGDHSVPAVFTEENGPTATAEAIARETGVEVAQLTMLMSGEGTGLDAYYDGMFHDFKTVVNALSGGQVVVE